MAKKKSPPNKLPKGATLATKGKCKPGTGIGPGGLCFEIGRKIPTKKGSYTVTAGTFNTRGGSKG